MSGLAGWLGGGVAGWAGWAGWVGWAGWLGWLGQLVSTHGGGMRNNVSFEDGGELESVTTVSHLRAQIVFGRPVGPSKKPRAGA